MRLTSIFQVVLLLVIEAAFGHASLRAAHTVGSHATDIKPCSCDCCLVQQKYHAVRSRGSGNLQCAPRSGQAPGGADGSGDGGCSDTCMLREDLRVSFKSESGEADYSRYCMDMCGPVSKDLNDLCVDIADIDQGVAEPVATVTHKENAMAQVHSEVNSGTSADGSNDVALLLLAKQKMQAAELSAEAAGKAAYTARMAYERLRRTKEEMAAKAAEATLDEIKAEAAQQSKKARDVRLAYENGARANAIKNAVNAASVYDKALARDLGVAQIWQDRAGQFAAAANQREQMGMDFSSEAEVYRKRNNIEQAQEKMVLAHQAIDQAAAFGAQSEAAHKQAQAIANSKPWYLYAKKAIAANILAKSMPGDLAPPPMPALPR